MKKAIIAGIVTYNPDIVLLRSEIKSIKSQVDAVYIYDNGSQNIENINALARQENSVLIKSNNNVGIAKASNKLCECAMNDGYSWILLLDHDTICPYNLIETYEKYMNIAGVGMYCPSVVDSQIVKNKWEAKSGCKYEYVEKCIQSATLVKIEAWEKCGGFDNWMFIDYVDFDFCKRLCINNYKILRCNEVVISHHLGKRKETIWARIFPNLKKSKYAFLRYITYKNIFSSSRIFYCSRNNLYYIRKYKDSINVHREIVGLVYRILKRLARGQNKIMILTETYRGLIAGQRKEIKRP